MSEKLRAVVDVRTRRVACVLLQAAWGGDRRVSMMFDSSAWEIAPTDDMRMVEGTVDEWRTLAAGGRTEP